MNNDADDTTPSEEMLVRYNTDLEGAKTPSEAKAISDRYLVEFPEQRSALLEFLDLTHQRLQRFAIPSPVPPAGLVGKAHCASLRRGRILWALFR